MLWHVGVERVTKDGSVERIETVVLAHTQRSAKILAVRTIGKESPGCEIQSMETDLLDISKTGVVFAMVEGEFAPLITRKEAAVGQW